MSPSNTTSTDHLLNELEDLRRKVKEYEDYFRNTPLPYQSLDENGIFIDVNPMWLKTLGYEREDVIGKPFELFLAPSDSSVFKQRFSRFKKEGHVSNVHFRLRHKKGFYKDVVFEGNVGNHPDGRFRQTYCVFKDITESKTAERTLAISLSEATQRTRELELILDNAKQILDDKADFQTTARNLFDTACTLTGARSGYVALLSPNGEENEVLFLESGGYDCTVDESLPMPVRGLRAEAYATGKCVYENDFMSSPWIKYMPEGHVTLKNVLFSPLVIEGKTVGVMGLANKESDFTENDARTAEAFGQLCAMALKNATNREKIRKEHVFSEMIVETSRAIILILDKEGNIVRYNRFMEELSGYQLKEVMHKNWFSTFVPSVDHADIREIFRKALLEKDLLGNINPIVAKNGKTIPIEWYNRTLKDAHGNPTGVLSIGIDIGHRLEMEKRLQQAEKMEAVGHLAGGIAHDFNNILGGIIGFADMALCDVPEGSRLARNLGRVLDSADRAKELVSQILSFSRRNPDIKTPQYIRPIVKEVAHLLRASLPSSIEITCDFHRDTKPVLANSTKIHEVIMNLCTNAAHAMNEKGILTIRYHEQSLESEQPGKIGIISPGDYSVIEIQDNGCGMAPETMEHIFEPFFTTKGVGEGTGMGLAVVHGIVQDHNGDVIITSSPGKGTTFRIFLPKTDGNPAEEPAQLEQHTGGSERILFIDDEEILCEVAEEMLGNLGYSVNVCSSSREALSLFEKTPDAFDLVITDQTMPDMSGFDLSRAILKIRKDLPIILCTGYSKSVDENKCLEAGIRSFCTKPVRQSVIAKKIRAILDEQ